MEEIDLAYSIIAQGFITFINVVVILGLFLNYLSSRHKYIGIACAAGLIEALRIIPDSLIEVYPDSFSVYSTSFLFQFIASLFLLLTLISMRGEARKKHYWLFGFLTTLFVISILYQYIVEMPQTTLDWYLHGMPIILVTLLIVHRSWISTRGVSPSRIFLVMTGLALLALRSYMPALDYGEYFLLIYYMELVLFPMMLLGFLLLEVEIANRRVNDLLAEKSQSEKDLQFILDNSLDLTVIASEVGLLQSWSNRGQEIFGYNDEQIIGKVHIDELFADNSWYKQVEKEEEFESQMEHVDGKAFKVRIRMRSVIGKHEPYTIFVIRDISRE